MVGSIILDSLCLVRMLVSYQMNVIFYDAMIMLPIVIVYLEELLDGKSPYRYAFALGLTVLLQFYMGHMIPFSSLCTPATMYHQDC